MTKQELYDLIDEVIKVNPLVVDQTKTRGSDNRALLKAMVEYLEDYAGGAGTDIPFDWSAPITANIPGLEGFTSTETTLGAGLRKALYRDLMPRITSFYVGGDTTREYGAPTEVSLGWSVQATTYPITSIVVAGQTLNPSLTTGTVQTSTPPNTPTTFTMRIETATQYVTASAGVNFSHMRMWFQSGNNLLTESDANISAILRSTNREFAGSRGQSRTFTLADEYTYFAYPASFGEAAFKVNGLSNNGFIPKTFTYTNQYGFTTAFILYRSGGKNSGGVAIDVL